MPGNSQIGSIGYCILKEIIGTGAGGTVYLAYHEKLQSQVAVKILNIQRISGDKGQRELKRFQREVRCASLLKHPNIVRVHETGEENGSYYIVMEYLKGSSLKEIIERGDPLSPQRTCEIAFGVTLALREAHRKGVVHRDVKPGNIFVLDSGEVKLTDFGLARAMDSPSGISQAGQIIGTIFYMSPEQAMGRSDVDQRADFYSLGITLFHALAGRLPYMDKTPLKVMEQHISAPIPFLREYNVPLNLENLVRKLMSKKPHQRFANADQILTQIAACQAALRSSAPQLRPPLIGSVLRRGRIVAMAIASLVLIGLAAAWLTGHGNIEPAAHTSQNANLQAEGPVPAVTLGWFGEKIPEGLERSREAGEYLWKKDESQMVYVPEGDFSMGDAEGNLDERPLRKVCLSAFYLDRYELTFRQYHKFCDATGYPRPQVPEYGLQPDHPVVNISWEDAREYGKWAGKRLPTEAEWEKAARGGFKIPDWEGEQFPIQLTANMYPRRTYPWGEELPHQGEKFYCNYVAYDYWKRRGEDGYVHTAPAGAFVAGISPYRCMDMSGNVWEWCEDCYEEDFYSKSQTVNPLNRGSASLRVLRGGSWFNFAESCRTTKRYKASPQSRLPWIGVRLAVSYQ